MARRTRSVSWIQGKILEVLSKQQEITTYLTLSAIVLREVRTIEEQHNLDIALQYLISKKQVTQQQDEDGFTTYQFAT